MLVQKKIKFLKDVLDQNRAFPPQIRNMIINGWERGDPPVEYKPWFGLVWVGLDWIGLDFCWFGLVWFGLVWIWFGTPFLCWHKIFGDLS